MYLFDPCLVGGSHGVPEQLGQVDVLQFCGFVEERRHLLRTVSGDAAAHGGDQERQLRVALGAGGEAFHGVFQRGLSLHGGQGVGATRKALADTPFGAEVLVGVPGSAAAVHALDVAAEDEDLAFVEGGDSVGGHAMSVDNMSVFHNERCFVFGCKVSIFSPIMQKKFKV